MNENETGPTVPRLPSAQAQSADDTKPRGGADSTPDPHHTADLPADTPATGDTAHRTPLDRARQDAEVQGQTGIVPGYVLLRELGRGGMGVVYEARHVKLNRVVALKMMLGAERAGKSELIRFLAEAEAVAAVKHENVVQVYDYGEADGRPFMALEYCPGGTLAKVLKPRKAGASRSAVRNAAELLVQVARGVAAAHKQGIVHRDLKPGNVFLDEEGTPKVADFGLAKRGEGTDVTQTGQVMGTPAYMSPEQAKGETKFVGPQADVWALGVMLYEALTGKRPFTGSVQEVLAQVQNADPVPPRKVVSSVPRDLELICLHCLAKPPHERYPTAKELADDLDRYLRHKPISVRPAGPVERAVKAVRRNWVVSTAVAAVILALATGAGVSFAYALKAEDKADEAQRKKKEADEALIAKDGALKAEQAALGLKDIALGNEKRATEAAGRIGYRSTVVLGFGEISQGNVLQARQRLAACPEQYREWEAHLLDRLCNKDVKRWPGQPMGFTAAVLAPDGSRLIAATRDESIHVWDRHTGQRLQTNRGHVNIVNALAVSPDGTLFASSGAEADQEVGEVLVWELATGHLLQRFAGTDGYYHALDFSPDGTQLAVGASKGVVAILNPRSGELLKTIKGHTGNGRSMQYSSDGKYLCWTCKDEAVEMWEVAGAKRACRFPPPMPAARSEGVAFSPDGKYLAIAWGLPTDRGEVGLWELSGKLEGELKQPHRKLPEHSNPVRAVEWSGDSRLLATGDAAGVVRVWDAGTGSEKHRMEAHALAVTSLSFEKNGRALASASADGRVRVWDTETGKPASDVLGSHVPVRCVAVSPDGRQVASGSSSVGAATGILIRDFETGNVVHGLYGHRHSIRSLCYSGDGTRLASASEDRTVIVWDPKTGKHLKTIALAPSEPISVALDHDGARLLITDSSGSVRLWSFADNRFIGTWQAVAKTGLRELAFGAAFEPRGTRFVTATRDSARLDGWVKVWDPAKPEPVLTLKQTGSAPPKALGPTVAWSPDGQWIAAVGTDLTGDSEISIWSANTQDGKPERKLTAPSGIQSVSFGADSSVLAMSSTDGKVWVYDRATRVSFPLTGHTRGANGAVVHPDGVHVISCGEDSTIRVWHRHLSRDALTFGLRLQRAALDPEGNLIALAGNTKVSAWDLTTGKNVFEAPSTGKTWVVGALALRPGRRLVTVAPEFTNGILETKAPHLEIIVRSLDQPEQVSRHVIDGYGGHLSPDGRLMTLRVRDDHVQVYDIDARKVICELSLPSDRSPTFAFRADGARLAVAAGLNTTVYELPSGRKLYDLRGHGMDVVPMAFSADGRWIATGTSATSSFRTTPGMIHVWDAATGRRVHIINGHKSGVTRLAFTHDGKRLVSAGEDRTVWVWDTATGEPLMRLPGSYQHPHLAMAFDRAGRLLVTDVASVRVWDGRPLTERLPVFGE